MSLMNERKSHLGETLLKEEFLSGRNGTKGIEVFLASSNAKFECIMTSNAGVITVRLHGALNEFAAPELDKLSATVPASSHVVIDWLNISVVNSLGAAAWIKFIKSFTKKHTVVFENCTPAVIGQINTVASFLSRASVKSVLAPNVCESCDESVLSRLEQNVDLPAPGQKAPLRPCPSCQKPMEMEEFEARFFKFVSRAS